MLHIIDLFISFWAFFKNGVFCYTVVNSAGQKEDSDCQKKSKKKNGNHENHIWGNCFRFLKFNQYYSRIFFLGGVEKYFQAFSGLFMSFLEILENIIKKRKKIFTVFTNVQRAVVVQFSVVPMFPRFSVISFFNFLNIFFFNI